MIKIVPTAAALISANAVTNGLMGMGIVPFLSEGWFGQKRSAASDNSWEISLSELFMKNLNMDKSQSNSFGNQPNPLMAAFARNLRVNGASSAIALFGAAAVPKVLSKTGVLRSGNKLLKQAGLGGVVQF
jgi:hypothetical protein